MIVYFQIYFHDSENTQDYLTRTGDGERPFVLSSNPHLFIKFETGTDNIAIPYVGFKAVYHFVTEPNWPDKPYSGNTHLLLRAVPFRSAL